MEFLKDIFGMPLFPHLYMIPITFVVGIMVGMQIKKIESADEELLPLKPKISQMEPKKNDKHDKIDL